MYSDGHSDEATIAKISGITPKAPEGNCRAPGGGHVLSRA